MEPWDQPPPKFGDSRDKILTAAVAVLIMVALCIFLFALQMAGVMWAK